MNLFILVCSEYDGTFVNLVSPESALSPTLNKIKYRLKCANLNKEAKWNGDWNVTFTKRQCLSVDVSYSAIEFVVALPNLNNHSEVSALLNEFDTLQCILIDQMAAAWLTQQILETFSSCCVMMMSELESDDNRFSHPPSCYPS